MKLTETAKNNLKIKFKEIIDTTYQYGIQSSELVTKADEFYYIMQAYIGRTITDKEKEWVSMWFAAAAKATICCNTIQERDAEFEDMFYRIEGGLDV